MEFLVRILGWPRIGNLRSKPFFLNVKFVATHVVLLLKFVDSSNSLGFMILMSTKKQMIFFFEQE